MKLSNMINLGIRIPLAKITKKRVPFQIFFRVIEQCNLHCTYCMDDYPREDRKLVKTQKILDAIDGFAQLGTRRMTIFGGEPLLRNDIGAIVHRVKNHKIDCSLTTNGRLIDKHAGLLKDLDQLSISLDDDQHTHDTYRGKGTWDVAVHAIKVAKQHNVPVQLMCTVTRMTDPKLENMFKLADEHDCLVDFNLVRPLFKPDGHVVLRPEDTGEEGVGKLLDYHIKNPHSRLSHNSYVMKYVRDWFAPYTKFNLFENETPNGTKINSCYAGRFFALVESNGDLLPCCVPRPDYKSPVNVFELGVEEAWANMPQNNCVTCRSLGYNNLNALLAFRLSSVTHLLKGEVRRRFQKKFCKT